MKKVMRRHYVVFCVGEVETARERGIPFPFVLGCRAPPLSFPGNHTFAEHVVRMEWVKFNAAEGGKAKARRDLTGVGLFPVTPSCRYVLDRYNRAGEDPAIGMALAATGVLDADFAGHCALARAIRSRMEALGGEMVFLPGIRAVSWDFSTERMFELRVMRPRVRHRWTDEQLRLGDVPKQIVDAPFDSRIVPPDVLTPKAVRADEFHAPPARPKAPTRATWSGVGRWAGADVQAAWMVGPDGVVGWDPIRYQRIGLVLPEVP